NYYELLKSKTISLFGWGKYRWFESFIAINFIWERYREDWVADLARIIKEQGADYAAMTELWKTPLNRWTFDTHIVNLGMMLKYEAVSCGILGEAYTDAAERLMTVLKAYNGTPVGLFTGDECLSGLSPIQGTELCAVAEQMYAYEHLFAYTGDSKWAERLELLAFNALPATISDDMWTHQYLQMSNQIACERFPGKPVFRTNGGEAHLFGLEPNYGCCTANFNQAWPKFALSAFMHSGDTVLSAIPVPSALKADGLTVSLKTNYPFDNTFAYDAESDKPVCLKVRVPSFAKNLRVNGQVTPYSEELSFEIPAGQPTHIDVTFDTLPNLVERPYDLKCAQCGSLVFSLPISFEKKMLEFERNGVERKFPYCDYEYSPTSPWNYAYSSPFFKLEKREISDIPFSSENPPVILKAEVKRIPWGLEDGYTSVCAKVPQSRIPLSEAETVELYPYGCAKLRMTELPLISL
ncbi:MAG: glycoside hydrolase family 127 protein, partial [Clostridia bacterium]|nr:glycoside hydrolase family 127 protein [Clostridia bacterium]